MQTSLSNGNRRPSVTPASEIANALATIFMVCPNENVRKKAENMLGIRVENFAEMTAKIEGLALSFAEKWCPDTPRSLESTQETSSSSQSQSQSQPQCVPQIPRIGQMCNETGYGDQRVPDEDCFSSGDEFDLPQFQSSSDLQRRPETSTSFDAFLPQQSREELYNAVCSLNAFSTDEEDDLSEGIIPPADATNPTTSTPTVVRRPTSTLSIWSRDSREAILEPSGAAPTSPPRPANKTTSRLSIWSHESGERLEQEAPTAEGSTDPVAVEMRLSVWSDDGQDEQLFRDMLPMAGTVDVNPTKSIPNVARQPTSTLSIWSRDSRDALLEPTGTAPNPPRPAKKTTSRLSIWSHESGERLEQETPTAECSTGPVAVEMRLSVWSDDGQDEQLFRDMLPMAGTVDVNPTKSIPNVARQPTSTLSIWSRDSRDALLEPSGAAPTNLPRPAKKTTSRLSIWSEESTAGCSTVAAAFETRLSVWSDDGQDSLPKPSRASSSVWTNEVGDAHSECNENRFKDSETAPKIDSSWLDDVVPDSQNVVPDSQAGIVKIGDKFYTAL